MKKKNTYCFAFVCALRMFSELLFISNGIVQGIFAIHIAYWGNRIHKISWLCGMVVFQSFTALIVIIPTLTHSER